MCNHVSSLGAALHVARSSAITENLPQTNKTSKTLLSPHEGAAEEAAELLVCRAFRQPAA